MSIPEVANRGLQSIREDSVTQNCQAMVRAERLLWLSATCIAAVASVRLWKGFVAVKPSMCYYCAPPTLMRIVAKHAPSTFGLIVTALCLGILAISIIQFTRPLGANFTTNDSVG